MIYQVNQGCRVRLCERNEKIVVCLFYLHELSAEMLKTVFYQLICIADADAQGQQFLPPVFKVLADNIFQVVFINIITVFKAI